MTAKGQPRTEKVREYHRRWHAANRDRVNACARARYARNPEAVNSYHKKKAFFLKTFYGITREDRDKIIEEQGGVCPGCNVVLDLTLRHQVQVDHDHETNKVRGVLCFGCNSAIGRAKDNAETLRRLAAYLEAHK